MAFTPNKKNLMKALSAINGVKLHESVVGYIAISRAGYTIYLKEPTGREVPTYKRLWDENKARIPETPAHLVFRYEVSQKLRSIDPQFNRVITGR